VTDPPPSSRLFALMVHGPRGTFRWAAFVLGVTSFAAAIPTPLYPVYEQQFGFTSGVLGLVFGAYTLGVLLTLFLVAPQAEYIGRKPLFTLAMTLTAIGAVVFAFASGVLWLALARVVTGLGVGATTSVATAALSDLEPSRDQHHVARVAVAANFGGFAVGVGLSGLVVQYVANASHLVYLLPIVACGVGLLALSVIPETAPGVGTRAKFRIGRIRVPPSIRRPFWVAAGGIAACYSIYGFFAALAPSYLRSGLGINSPVATGELVGLMFGMAAVTQLLTYAIRDRRALLVGFPLLLATLVALVLTLSLTSWMLLALVTAGLGVAVGLTFMGSATLVDRVLTEDERDEILAGYYSAGYLALAVPTIGVAEASERIGLTGAGILFGSFLAVAVLLLYVAIYRTPTPSGGGGRPRATP
jgi:MFS family permease